MPVVSQQTTSSGFTLIELVVILVLVGILSVVAGPVIWQRLSFDAAAFHDRALATVRYAQKTAIAQRRPTLFVSGYMVNGVSRLSWAWP